MFGMMFRRKGYLGWNQYAEKYQERMKWINLADDFRFRKRLGKRSFREMWG